MAARNTPRPMGRAVGVLAAAVVIDVVVAAARSVLAPAGRVVERGTGRAVVESRPLVERVQIILAWTTVTGSQVLCRCGWFLRYLERITFEKGRAMDAPASAADIERFVADHDVDVSELERPIAAFGTLNEFFTRRLAPGSRPAAAEGDPTVAVSPADSRVICVECDGASSGLVVKGRRRDLATLLGLGARVEAPGTPRLRRFHADAERRGCSVAVCRLAPGDLHRFAWPVSGIWRDGDALEVPGEYHSVAAPCVAGPVDVLGRNRRSVAVIGSEVFGDVVLVAVGATKVASIQLTASSGPVTKGDEAGYFAYGGSTLVVVFLGGTISFDAELVANSAGGLETLVRMGSLLGHSTASTRPASGHRA